MAFASVAIHRAAASLTVEASATVESIKGFVFAPHISCIERSFK
jgi:hypothetical protein